MIAQAPSQSWLGALNTVIIDDAHSLLEPEVLVLLTSLSLTHLLLVGSSADLPRVECRQAEGTAYEKSLFTRLVEREYPTIEVKS